MTSAPDTDPIFEAIAKHKALYADYLAEPTDDTSDAEALAVEAMLKNGPLTLAGRARWSAIWTASSTPTAYRKSRENSSGLWPAGRCSSPIACWRKRRRRDGQDHRP